MNAIKASLTDSSLVIPHPLLTWMTPHAQLPEVNSMFSRLNSSWQILFRNMVNKNMSQENVSTSITKLGGKVAKQLLGKFKGNSTKWFIVLNAWREPKRKIPKCCETITCHGVSAFHLINMCTNPLLLMCSYQNKSFWFICRPLHNAFPGKCHFRRQQNFITAAKRKCRYKRH